MVSHRRKMNRILSASCLLPSIFFLLCSCLVDCYARDTLKLGEWLTDNGTTLVSSEGEFELGFFTPIRNSSHNRYVGIWYKWDNQTVVWVANRDSLVLNGSTGVSFGIAGDGSLTILNTTGHVYWNITTGVEISPSRNRIVKLMDSGNLVLSDVVDELETSLWESFQYPTDTFLPGMKMGESLKLTSWIGDGDPGSGNFTFKQDLKEGEGRYVISKKSKPFTYWRNSMSASLMRSDELPGSIADLLTNIRSSNSFNFHPCVAQQVFYKKCESELYSPKRLVMNYTGELQYYRNWSLIWWRRPEDECGIDKACGKFGSCNINNRPFVCKCLPGFQPSEPEKWKSSDFLDGCTRNWTSTGESDMFLSLKMMKVSNADSDVKVKNETECRKECLVDSQCQAYSYGTTDQTDLCLIWTEDLSNLQEEYTYGVSSLSVRVAKSVLEPIVKNCKPCGTNLIPYPLSTGPNCGDPMYFSFDCDTSTGQVSFNASNGTYRVVIINPSTRKFVIRAGYDKNSTGTLQLNDSLPFTVDSNNNSTEVKYEVEISWKTPQEPNCNSSRDCRTGQIQIAIQQERGAFAKETSYGMVQI